MARSFVDSWINRLKASAREEIQQTARGMLLYAVAAVLGLIGLVFLTLAVFWWLSSQLTATPAALVIAGFYAIIAIVVLMWASLSSGTPVSEPPPEQAAVAETEAKLQDISQTMGVDLETVARTLAGAGFRTESLVVSASSELARHLTPLQFVGLVFVASFFFGRRLGRR